MKKKKKKKSDRHLNVRHMMICVLVLSVVIGAWRSWSHRKNFLPMLNGEITSIIQTKPPKQAFQEEQKESEQPKEPKKPKEPEPDLLACTRSGAEGDMLMLFDEDGTLRNYYTASDEMTFQRDSLFQTKYGIGGILNTSADIDLVLFKQHNEGQKLVTFRQDEKNKSALLEDVCIDLPDKYPEKDKKQKIRGIEWQHARILQEEDEILYQAVGVDNQGKAVMFSQKNFENTKEITYIDDIQETVRSVAWGDGDDFTWIGTGERGSNGNVGRQNVGENLLDSKSRMPNHIVYCGDQAFVADSITGDIYRIPKTKDEMPERIREGSKTFSCNENEYAYRDLRKYLIEEDQGKYSVWGIVGDNEHLSIVHENQSAIDYLKTDVIDRIALYWSNFWTAFLIAFALLSVLVFFIYQIAKSRKLSNRLISSEMVVLFLLMGTVVHMQLKTFHDAENQEEIQQIEVLNRILAAGLDADESMDDLELREKMTVMWDQIARSIPNYENERQYKVQVLWKDEKGMTIGYDRNFPAGCPLTEVGTQGYRDAVLKNDESLKKTSIIRDGHTTKSLCVQEFQQGEKRGCVVMSRPTEVQSGISTFIHIFESIFPLLILFPILFLWLLKTTRRILRPLNTIQDAMEKFYQCDGENQIDLKKIPRTELFGVGQVFNQLSKETKVQMNQLNSINESYARIVPNNMLNMLQASDVAALKPGAFVQEEKAILVLVPDLSSERSVQKPEFFNALIENVGYHNGIVVDHDEKFHALTALFVQQEQALECGKTCVDQNLPVLAAVFQEEVQFGVFGGTQLLFPIAFTTRMKRHLAVLDLLRQFGTKVIRCDAKEDNLRLMGWDNGQAYYDDPSCYSSEWQTIWQDAAPIWTEAVNLYHEKKFSRAMHKFAQVLQLMPEDQAAHWYLFRCEKMRNQKYMENCQESTDLLCDGGDTP